jgi:hypothetical protein
VSTSTAILGGCRDIGAANRRRLAAPLKVNVVRSCRSRNIGLGHSPKADRDHQIRLARAGSADQDHITLLSDEGVRCDSI